MRTAAVAASRSRASAAPTARAARATRRPTCRARRLRTPPTPARRRRSRATARSSSASSMVVEATPAPRIRTTTSSCTTAARPQSTSPAGRCSTRRRRATAGISTGSRSAERSVPASTYLIALASGGADGAALPPANINGQINMSGTSGKIALVNSFDGLIGNCPTGDPHVMDFVGYGSADCREGTTTAPAPSNTTSIFRAGRWKRRHRQQWQRLRHGHASAAANRADRRARAAGAEYSDPRVNGTNAPRDATIEVTFTEPVDVVGSWFDITCALSGPHNSATFAGGGQTPLHHAERQLPAGRAVHGHDLQRPDSRSGSGRRRSEHRHAAGELHLVIHGGDRHRAALSHRTSI